MTFLLYCASLILSPICTSPIFVSYHLNSAFEEYVLWPSSVSIQFDNLVEVIMVHILNRLPSIPP
ncbi:hypothetical protein CVS40_5504 [Lucilia cuprina]|nr:hypothetical protein CVS40_5504 [Lucilia cuprina]